MSEEVQLIKIYGYVNSDESKGYEPSEKSEIIFEDNKMNIMNMGNYIIMMLDKGCSNVYVERVGKVETL